MAFDRMSFRAFRQTWTLGAAATGSDHLSPVGLGVASAQVTGTFGGATVSLDVSNDGTNWAALADKAGTPIAFTAAGMADICSGALYVRAKTTGGSGTSVTVTLAAWGA